MICAKNPLNFRSLKFPRISQHTTWSTKQNYQGQFFWFETDKTFPVFGIVWTTFGAIFFSSSPNSRIVQPEVEACFWSQIIFKRENAEFFLVQVGWWNHREISALIFWLPQIRVNVLQWNNRNKFEITWHYRLKISISK
jgi:hypothetical protein